VAFPTFTPTLVPANSDMNTTYSIEDIIKKKNPKGDQWTPEHTYLFISSLPQFQHYAKQFLDQKIGWRALLALNKQELENRSPIP